MASPDFQLFSSLRYDPLLLQSTTNTSVAPELKETPFYMLSYHRDRILQAAQQFGWSAAISVLSGPEGIAKLIQKMEEDFITKSSSPLRVKILVAQDGTITTESNGVPAVPMENLYPARLPAPASASIGLKVSPLTGGALTLGNEDTIPGDPVKGEAWKIIPDSFKTTPSPFTTYKTTSRKMYDSARDRFDIKNMAEKKEILIVSDVDGAIMEGTLTSVFFWRNGRWVTPPVSSGGQAGTTRRWLLEKGLCVEEAVNVESLVEGEECWISNGVRGFSWGKVGPV